MSERIQKLLSTLGVASRRGIEKMIEEGRITVNGVAATPGQAIDTQDQVRVDGRVIGLNRAPEPSRVLIYKKQVGEVVTRDDPEGRRTVFRKLPKLTSGRWIAIGRLDINTSGLLLLTNDGELARRLMHPSYEIPREYAVRIHGQVTSETIKTLTQGVMLEDGMARFETMRAENAADDDATNQWFRVKLREGRNREVRRLVESQNLEVSRLIRVSYGPIALGRGIKSSSSREATSAEVEALFEAVGMNAEPAKPGKRTRATAFKAGQIAYARSAAEPGAPGRAGARKSSRPDGGARGDVERSSAPAARAARSPARSAPRPATRAPMQEQGKGGQRGRGARVRGAPSPRR